MSSRPNPPPPPSPPPLSSEELDSLLARTRSVVAPGDFALLERLVTLVRSLLDVVARGRLSLWRLSRLLFGPRTEKRDGLFPNAESSTSPGEDAPTAPPSPPPEKEKKKRKGHGRIPAASYTASRVIHVAHPELDAGSCCPGCKEAKLSVLPDPARTLRILGQPLLIACLWEAVRLRCNSCQEVFTAPLPEEARGPKFNEAARAMIALLQYGNGFPGFRLARLQKELGVPVAASVQWEQNQQTATDLMPVVSELITKAAQGHLFHNDDTKAKIQELAKADKASPPGPAASRKKKKRKGIFTTNIVAKVDGHSIALYFTGKKHAGENLADLLRRRHVDLPPPVLMCDALSRNYPKGFLVILANCLAHGRRKFVDIVPMFPAECQRVIDDLATVYHFDELARADKLSPDERLRLHQEHSEPIMKALHDWLVAQFREKKVEPNSALGKAIAYLLAHWKPLTLFLRQPGAPLDNNICERALKLAILRRKNALFYKTEAGAAVGDAVMSVIHTCRLCGANPLDYLTAVLENRERVKAEPAAWLPWNFPAKPPPPPESG